MFVLPCDSQALQVLKDADRCAVQGHRTTECLWDSIDKAFLPAVSWHDRASPHTSCEILKHNSTASWGKGKKLLIGCMCSLQEHSARAVSVGQLGVLLHLAVPSWYNHKGGRYSQLAPVECWCKKNIYFPGLSATQNNSPQQTCPVQKYL